MWRFWGKRKNTPKHPNYISIGGIEPGLDTWSLEFRESRITEIIENTGKTHLEATEIADLWFIRTLQVQIGDEPAKIQYSPMPVWDTDWAWRKMFDTWDEALAYIEGLKKT